MLNIWACNIKSDTSNFHELLAQDKEGDRKSIEWNAVTKKATLVKDELDNKSILDGRGYGLYNKVDIDEEYQFTYKDNEKPEKKFKVLNNNPSNYILSSANQRIEIQEIDYNTEKDKLTDPKNIEQYQPTDTLYIKEDRVNLFKEYEVFSSIIDIPETNKAYAGYTIIFTSELNNKSYKITCTGEGLLPDIQLQTEEIINSFRVYFW